MKQKRLCYRAWKKGTGTRAAYDVAKRAARRVVSKKDRAAWRLDGVNPADRVEWRNEVRTARTAASQLSGNGANDL